MPWKYYHTSLAMPTSRVVLEDQSLIKCNPPTIDQQVSRPRPLIQMWMCGKRLAGYTTPGPRTGQIGRRAAKRMTKPESRTHVCRFFLSSSCSSSTHELRIMSASSLPNALFSSCTGAISTQPGAQIFLIAFFTGNPAGNETKKISFLRIN